jgi:hypothetical protein
LQEIKMPARPFIVRTDCSGGYRIDKPYSSHTSMSAALKMIHKCVTDQGLISSSPSHPWRFWVADKAGTVLAGPFDHGHLPPRP